MEKGNEDSMEGNDHLDHDVCPFNVQYYIINLYRNASLHRLFYLSQRCYFLFMLYYKQIDLGLLLKTMGTKCENMMGSSSFSQRNELEYEKEEI